MSILQKLRVWWAKRVTSVHSSVGRDYMCGCGHTAKWKTVLTVGGGGIYTLPSEKPDYCPECWAKAAIRCAWCGDTILPGDPITLYTPRKNDFVVPEHAVVYRREPQLQLVGCLGWDCAHTGADRSGFWVMPGEVRRVLSPLEELIANGGTEVVISGNLGDIRQAIPISDQDP